jgi:hypothetical protein
MGKQQCKFSTKWVFENLAPWSCLLTTALPTDKRDAY